VVSNFRLTALPGGSAVKNPPANAGDTGDAGSTPGSGRSPGGRNGNLLEYSCLGRRMNSGSWGGLPSMGSQKSQTQLSTNTQAQLQTDTLTPTRALGKDGGSWSSISHTTEMSLLLSWLASGLTPLQTVPLPCSEPPMHASLVAQTVKNLPAVQGTGVQS